MEDKTIRRVLRFLARAAANIRVSASPDRVLLESAGHGTISTRQSCLRLMQQAGLIARKGETVMLTEHGRSFMRGNSPAPGRDLEDILVETDGESRRVAFNCAESPLCQLYRRKGADGKPFLTAEEFAAGERLRSDFTRGNLMSGIGVNWETSVAGRNRAAGNGAAELTDAALAARFRVEKAIEAVGPELSGVLIDICCFLKGLETVERERRWPARSAKLLLKAALGALDRHYHPRASAKPGRSRILQWGAADYRPSVGG
ncbi:hypothetical protein ATN84_00365 [Paramesorhizobium deserti]|uniref:DUF6456 domain-containing protein n=2 Tax=Paramesorhizobium deserti TaxID=1494590 RepID=A0A135I1Y1_9HYPH|nr:hypothetical protein ATN84_00365 [Paramesorhizobium deserti]